MDGDGEDADLTGGAAVAHEEERAAAACEDVWWCMVRKTACWLWLGDVDSKE